MWFSQPFQINDCYIKGTQSSYHFKLHYLNKTKQFLHFEPTNAHSFIEVTILVRITITEFYVYWTVHHLYSCVKRKNQLDATYFIIYSILIQCSTCFGR